MNWSYYRICISKIIIIIRSVNSLNFYKLRLHFVTRVTDHFLPQEPLLKNYVLTMFIH